MWCLLKQSSCPHNVSEQERCLVVDWAHEEWEQERSWGLFSSGFWFRNQLLDCSLQRSGKVNPLSTHSPDLLVGLSNSFIKLDGSASLSVKYLAKSKIGKTKYLILDRLETSSCKTTPKTNSGWLTWPKKSALAIFPPSHSCVWFFRLLIIRQLRNAEFQKAELYWFLPMLAQTIRNWECH